MSPISGNGNLLLKVYFATTLLLYGLTLLKFVFIVKSLLRNYNYGLTAVQKLEFIVESLLRNYATAVRLYIANIVS